MTKPASRSRSVLPAPVTPTGRVLTALLDSPELVRQLRALPNAAASGLVQHIGLEDSGEILALLSIEQLTGLLDDVLWQAGAPGADESFDLARFVTWLEVMLEAGDDFLADRLAELSEDLLTLAVSRLALVLDFVEVQAAASARDDGELVEKALDGTLYQEVGDYVIVARRHNGWDALVTAVVALDARHGDVLQRVLHRCCSAAHEQWEDHGGLYELLTAEDVFEVDAAAEREDRRAALGYVSPASARAFLGLAKQGAHDIAPGEQDAITRAYFRELDVALVRQHRRPPDAGDVPALGLLLEGTLGEAAKALPPAQVEASMPAPVLRALLRELADALPELHSRSVEELAYLANVLVAGDPWRGRPWRAAEAAEHVLGVCERGLVRLQARDAGRPGSSPSAETIERWGLVAAFRAGWTPGDRSTA